MATGNQTQTIDFSYQYTLKLLRSVYQTTSSTPQSAIYTNQVGTEYFSRAPDNYYVHAIRTPSR